MGEAVFFRNLTTKGLTAVNSGERYFEGYLTVQVKDKQGEVTIVDELMKVLPIWIDRGAPISDTHSNRIIGKGINYARVDYKDKDGEIYPAIQITGKIHKNYELDNDIWQKIKSGEYKGLSFGGATKSDREPMRMKDGSIAYSLKDLEHYEVAVCRDPAVPLALITEFNTLAKAVVDGEDLGDGRMLIKCDKYGCYVDKANNSEGGLKAPEARNEALVYDDKTHDQPSETPEENQKKLKKGKDDAKDAQHMDESEAVFRHATGQDKGVRDTSVAGQEDMPKQKQIRHEIADEKGYRGKGEKCPYCAAQEKDMAIMTVTPKQVDEKATHDAKHKKKGEDWSNADGDRHSMYNQDTDEGGMGKKHTGPKGCKCGDPKCKDPKCKKREVGTGYGAEDNDTGEVHWSGSGSPYPKKKKAIMTNIHTRLKNLDFLLRGVNNEGKEDDEVSSEHATHHTPHHKWVKNPNHSGYLLDDDIGSKEDIKRRDDEIEEKLRKRKKKAVMTNVHSRLKSLDFLLRGQCHMEHEGSCAEAQATESSEETKRKHGKKQKKEAKKGEAQLKSIQSRIGISDFLLRAAPIGTGADEPGNKPSQRKLDEQKELDDSGYSMSVHDWIKGQHTRQGQADEANYGWDEGKWEGLDELTSGGKKTGKKDIIESYPDKKGTKQSTKKSYFERVKDGEFGGMNTGETEWTEPRDTANSRTKRDKDVA